MRVMNTLAELADLYLLRCDVEGNMGADNVVWVVSRIPFVLGCLHDMLGASSPQHFLREDEA